jgi:hypothetical protein
VAADGEGWLAVLDDVGVELGVMRHEGSVRYFERGAQHMLGSRRRQRRRGACRIFRASRNMVL